ncbi:MAG: hypothetical protein WDO74_01420 [Pseudomonadota bacterium]
MAGSSTAYEAASAPPYQTAVLAKPAINRLRRAEGGGYSSTAALGPAGSGCEDPVPP